MKIEVFSSDHCPWCVRAKRFLRDNNIKFEEIDVNKPENRDKTREAVRATGQTGIPIIRIDKEYIVGFDEERIRELLKIKD